MGTDRRGMGRRSRRGMACRALSATLTLPLLVWLPVAARGAEPVTVRDCVRLALARSPAVLAAAFEADAAAAQARSARAAYSPRLLVQGEYGRSQGFDETVTNGGSTAALLTVETPLLDGGLRDARFAAARAQLRSASALEQQRRADVALAVQTAYFAAVAARAEAAIERDSIGVLRDYLVLLRRQVALGVAPQNDVLRAELGRETARSARRAAQAQLDTACGELAVLTGAEVNAASLVEPEVLPFVEPSGEMIEASPVLVDARAAADAARREADAVRSEWRTHVTLTASGGALGVDPGPTFHDNGGGQFLVGLSFPVFDNGVTAAKISAAVAAADGAEARVQQTRQTLVLALARTRVAARRAQADLTASRRARPTAEEDFQLMRARYFGGGNVRLLEVLDALNQYVEVRLGEPRAARSYGEAVATARQILGESTP